MDNLEEFEMRPLTSGLGFQKKMAEMKQSMRRSNIASEKLAMNLPVAPPPDEMTESTRTNSAPGTRKSEQIISEIRQALKPMEAPVKLSTTLPRPGERVRTNNAIAPETEINRRPNPGPSQPESDPLANINFHVPNREMVDKTTGTRRGASDSMIRPLVPTTINVLSAIIDGVIVLALSMIFLAALVSVTGIEVNSVLTTAKGDMAAQVALGVMALAVLELYLILARSFFGRTVGEWTFDMQLGEDQQIQNAMYPLRVLGRSFLNLITGLVVLPLISLLAGKDIAGQLSGVRLYKQNT